MPNEPFNILLVEDNLADADLLEEALRESHPGGYALTHVERLTDAVQRLETARYDLVLLDLSLPDSFGLYTVVRAREDMPNVPIVVLTGIDDDMLGIEAVQAGAQDYLVKGRLDGDLLVRALHYAVARHAMQREVEASHDLFARINLRMSEMFMGMPIPCYTYDAEGRIREWNRACERLYGLHAWQVIDKPVWETIARPEDEPALRKLVRSVFAGKTWVGLECAQRRSDGAAIDIECSTFPLRDPDGTIVAAISANLDVTSHHRAQAQIKAQMELIEAHMLEINEKSAQLEYQKMELEAANTKLKALATTDGLTGVKNHRAFQDGLEQEFRRASRYNLPLSLLLIDVDKFKQYNDSYGHPAGDEVLQTVGRILKETARETDFVARYGGEEFAAVLPNTDAAAALVVAERFRAAIEAEPWPLRAVTASFGAASVTAQATGRSQLIIEADAALYASKQRGRNRAVHFESLASERDPPQEAA